VACREIARFFKTLRQAAEQLTPFERWCCRVSHALVKCLNGRLLRPQAHFIQLLEVVVAEVQARRRRALEHRAVPMAVHLRISA
jgi:hypothetical protein